MNMPCGEVVVRRSPHEFFLTLGHRTQAVTTALATRHGLAPAQLNGLSDLVRVVDDALAG